MDQVMERVETFSVIGLAARYCIDDDGKAFISNHQPNTVGCVYPDQGIV